MYQDNREPPSLPKAFRHILVIPSRGTGRRLTLLVSSILELVEEVRDYTPPPSTTRAVNNFFDYLKKSCVTPELITRRSNWMMCYAQIVHDLLVDHHNSRHRHTPVDADDAIQHELLITTERLVLAVITHRFIHKKASSLDDDISKLLTGILDQSREVLVREDSSDYLDIVRKAAKLAVLLNTFNSIVPTPGWSDQADQHILFGLKSLSFNLHRLIATQRYKR